MSQICRDDRCFVDFLQQSDAGLAFGRAQARRGLFLQRGRGLLGVTHALFTAGRQVPPDGASVRGVGSPLDQCATRWTNSLHALPRQKLLKRSCMNWAGTTSTLTAGTTRAQCVFAAERCFFCVGEGSAWMDCVEKDRIPSTFHRSARGRCTTKWQCGGRFTSRKRPGWSWNNDRFGAHVAQRTIAMAEQQKWPCLKIKRIEGLTASGLTSMRNPLAVPRPSGGGVRH